MYVAMEVTLGGRRTHPFLRAVSDGREGTRWIVVCWWICVVRAHLTAIFLPVSMEVRILGLIVKYSLSSPRYIEGLMVGGIVLLYTNKLVGEKRVIYLYGNLPWGTICICICTLSSLC